MTLKPFALLTLLIATLTAPANAKPVILGTVDSYTIVREDRRTCYATIALLSLNGVRVSLSLYQRRSGKVWQTVSYDEGNRPKRRRDRISLKFDGGEFYNRRIKMDRDGVFEIPNRSRSENIRFLKKFTERERMVLLMEKKKDSFVLQLVRTREVVDALENCVKGK